MVHTAKSLLNTQSEAQKLFHWIVDIFSKHTTIKNRIYLEEYWDSELENENDQSKIKMGWETKNFLTNKSFNITTMLILVQMFNETTEYYAKIHIPRYPDRSHTIIIFKY